MTRFLKKNGVVIEDRNYAKKLAGYLCGDPIPDLISRAGKHGLVFFYVYDMERQPIGRREQDAEIWKDVTTDGNGTWYAIGISTQALNYGKEYTVLVFLHEITHLLTDCEEEHTEIFHAYLDKLLKNYNAANKTAIKNDYYGLPRRT